MTTRERIIVSAYTGVRMCNMALIDAYIQEKIGRVFVTNEWGTAHFRREVQEAVKEDFLLLCE